MLDGKMTQLIELEYDGLNGQISPDI